MIASAAEDWEFSRTFIVIVAVVPFVLPIITIVAGVVHRPTFDMLTAEDQLGEWMQVLA